jgi:hypothetical protein
LPRLRGKGWVLVTAGGFRLAQGERYELAVRGAGLTGEPDFTSAVCDGPRSFKGIDWSAVLAFRPPTLGERNPRTTATR